MLLQKRMLGLMYLSSFLLSYLVICRQFFIFKIWECIFSPLFSLLAPQSTIPSVDEVLVSIGDIDPVHRLDAKEAKARHQDHL